MNGFEPVKECIYQYTCAGQWGVQWDEEIVRCRDCDHRRRSWNGRNPNFTNHFFCAYTGGHEVKPDGFCAWGVRRDA